MSDQRREVVAMRLVSGEEIVAMMVAHEGIEKHDGTTDPHYMISKPVLERDLKTPWTRIFSMEETVTGPIPIPSRNVMFMRSLEGSVREEVYLYFNWSGEA